uniref:Uncharacterized protein n=1 Tax=Nothobranchius furzeri TaxID=105023 RepID=A0A8C6P049_NOTFU
MEPTRRIVVRILDQQRFSCGDPKGQCISTRWVCDGDKDCPNDADENNCGELVSAYLLPSKSSTRTFSAGLVLFVACLPLKACGYCVFREVCRRLD